MHETQSFGTPLQDALRRDLTINALFYNVHSREVEDFTGQVRPTQTYRYTLLKGVFRVWRIFATVSSEHHYLLAKPFLMIPYVSFVA